MTTKLIELAKSKKQQRQELRDRIRDHRNLAREQEEISMYHARMCKQARADVARMERRLASLKP